MIRSVRTCCFTRVGLQWAFGSLVLGLSILVLSAGAGLRADDKTPDEPPRPVPSAPASLPPTVSPIPPESFAQQAPKIQLRRFQFKIAADAPLKELVPAAPKTPAASGRLAAEDLAKVPEVQFQAPLTRELGAEKALEQTALAIARVNHVNAKKTDAFMDALRGQRPDLNGLPFAMGDACRTKGERSREFSRAVALVRQALRSGTFTFQVTAPNAPLNSGPALLQNVSGTVTFAVPSSAPHVASGAVAQEERTPAENFWHNYRTACAQDDRRLAQVDKELREHVTQARIAALVQVLAPETPSLRLGLVQHLAAISHVEATRALARLAVFAAEDEVHKAAVEALKVRRERDYTEILVQGLRYPWPTAARNAANAMVRLERTDLQAELVGLLEEADPRAPRVQEVDQKQVPVLRELVRVNHHRNCLLCHAPGNTGSVSPEALSAAVPLPTEPLPSPGEGYNVSHPDVLVRVDVTYLRQDFSMFQAVADANPWPEMQRFDFLVRNRVLTDEEAAAYRAELAEGLGGKPSPYQRAALAALREMTGLEGEPNAETWRRLLKLPNPQRAAAIR